MEPMKPELLQSLLKKQLQGTINEEEGVQLQNYVQDAHNKEAVTHALAVLLEQQQADIAYDHQRFDPILQAVLQADKPEAIVIPVRRRAYRWLAAAAILIVIAGAGLFYLYRGEEQGTPNGPAAVLANDALPGQDGAILTLADGQRIVLDSTRTGVVEEQGMKAVIQDGMLVYEVPAGTEAPVSYNTMSTPRGRQFQVVLPDGTRVWLNAASSITYPTRFEENTRAVSITGEVYFEVAPSSRYSSGPGGGGEKKPFLVKVNDNVEVEVLGTHFNINIYDADAGIATTLLEGAVKVRSGNSNGVLKPGEQMMISNGKLKRRSNVDVEAIMAWKEGRFHFNNTPIAVVMGELQRWYDVEIVYESGVPEGSLSGEFPRSLLLSEVLRILELSGIHYKIENKKLIVSGK